MEQEKIYLPDLLQTLSSANFAQIETNVLIRLALKTKAAKVALEQKGKLNPIEMTLYNGFTFYDQQMEKELQRRNCCLVDVNQLLLDHIDWVEEILKEYPLEQLLKLLDESSTAETSALQKLHELVEKEIMLRSSRCRAEA